MGDGEPIKAEADAFETLIPDKIVALPPDVETEPELPATFSPTKRKRWMYYGSWLPEFRCYYAENMSQLLHQMDPTRDLNALRIQVASLQRLTMSVDPKVRIMAEKIVMELAGLGVAWEHKKKAGALDLNVQVSLKDLILQATEKAKLLRAV